MANLALVRSAAGLLWFTALGFGMPCVMAIRELAAGRSFPYVMGYPAYGNGPFEAHGIPTTLPLLVGFLAVSLLEAVAGWLLWTGHTWGAYLAMLSIIPGLAYWWGFALPIPPMLAIAWSILIAVGWKSLV